MKKAIWITATVMVISLLCTVCFGVALGSQGIQSLISQDWDQQITYWSQHIHNIGNALDVIDDFTDVDAENMPKLNEQIAELPLSNDFYIRMDCGEVIVKRGTGDKIIAKLEQFSWNTEETRNLVLAITNDNTLAVSYPKGWNGIRARLTVTIPHEITTLDITVGAGKLELEDITATTLSAHVKAGDVSLERVTVKTATVHADIGEIEIDGDTRAEESLIVTSDCGNVEFDIPRTAPFVLDFQVETGDIKIDTETERLHNAKIQRAATGGNGYLFRNDTGKDVKCHILITVKLGDLKIDEAD